jgi:hypothetical protein
MSLAEVAMQQGSATSPAKAAGSSSRALNIPVGLLTESTIAATPVKVHFYSLGRDALIIGRFVRGRLVGAIRPSRLANATKGRRGECNHIETGSSDG